MRSIHRAFIVALAFCISAAAALAGPSSAASPAPAASAAASPVPENPALTKLARGEVDAWTAGKIDRTHYSAQANTQLPDALVTKVSGYLVPLGKVKAFAYSGVTTINGLAVTQYAMTFENAATLPNGATIKDFLESIAVDKDGKITFIYFSPKPAL